MLCKNCQTKLEPTDDFCKSCGGKIIRNRLTLKNLFQHFSEQFLNYDNRFLQTFVSLFTKPDDVIDGYINGVRKKYVNVISYFAIALTVSGLQLLILDKFFPETMDLSAMATSNAGPDSNEMMSFIREYQSLLMMVNVPMYALVSYFVFYTLKKYNYTEHLVIFMYVLSQLTFVGTFISITSAFFGLSLAHSSMILSPIQVLYSMYCLKRLYKLSIKGLILRTLLFFGIIVVGFILIMVTVAVLAIMFKDSDFMQSIIEAQKAGQEVKN
ncbi:DUF3667 domain-containing protein [Hanstruepera ponticola]|uniref:DUF3667 domain-containing protein n=1 Tax=Hanstruepera ponticola TaxID=2042995 RepID=UPI000CF0B440|nr:DUF3667 domain-containing protein [Hanstruepera ponticola]